ncbi:unnamed protein product [Clavelina lepadiformis]|uniref:Protein kinase domain-containing protein n=1 Tax=Clavelina lepadiformis TaxID=159417 RepID=A0ABP0F2U1_CLALP
MSDVTQVIRQFRAEEFLCVPGDDGCLGRGNFGNVRIGFHDVLGTVAIKCFPVQGGRDEKRLLEKKVKKEMSSLLQSGHENIVRILGWAQWASAIGIVMEYLPAGNLKNILLDEDVILAPLLRLRCGFEVSNGLSFIHNLMEDKRLTHGDVKPENVVLTDDLHCKLADFGGAQLSSYTGASSMSGRHVTKNEFTQIYAAPEQLRDISSPTTTSRDVYSYGMLLYTIVARRTFVKSESEVKLYLEEVKRGQRPNLDDVYEYERQLERKSKLDEAGIIRLLLSEMKMCWQQDPDNRPRITHVCDRFREHLSKPQFTVMVMQQCVIQALHGMEISKPARNFDQCLSLDRFLSPSFCDVTMAISEKTSSSGSGSQCSSGNAPSSGDESYRKEFGTSRKAGSVFKASVNTLDALRQLERLTDAGAKPGQTTKESSQARDKVKFIQNLLKSSLVADAIAESKELITMVTMYVADVTDGVVIVKDIIALSQMFLETSENMTTLSLLRCAVFLSANIPDTRKKLSHFSSCCRAIFNVVISMNNGGFHDDIKLHALPLLNTMEERIANVSAEDDKDRDEAMKWCRHFINHCNNCIKNG